MFLVQYKAMILITLSTITYLAAAFMVIKFKQSLVPKRSRLRLIESIKNQRKALESYLTNDSMENLFRSAGYPLKLNSFRYQLIRFVLLVTMGLNVVISILSQYQELSSMKITLMVTEVGLFYFLTSQSVALSWLLNKVKEIYIANKNRELFMIYSIIQDDLMEADSTDTRGKDSASNLYSIMKDIRKYTHYINGPLDKCINAWKNGVKNALEILAREIGTADAEELCKILADIDESDTKKALEIMESRKETFITAQKENKRRRLKLYGIYGYIGAFVPLLLYIWNLLTVIGLYTQQINDTINNFH